MRLVRSVGWGMGSPLLVRQRWFPSRTLMCGMWGRRCAPPCGVGVGCVVRAVGGRRTRWMGEEPNRKRARKKDNKN